jgi:lipopolysaccharide biosynthesis regulator YciM
VAGADGARPACRAQGQPARALEWLFDALEHNPHALAIHQAIWGTLSTLDLPRHLVARYIEITRESVFYLDSAVCVQCRYRSTELIWQCPHCHEWNTFVEERIHAERHRDYRGGDSPTSLAQ